MPSGSNNYYVNPIGGITELSYNNISNYLNTKDTTQARIKDTNSRFTNKRFLITTYSIILAIFILILIMFIRNFK